MRRTRIAAVAATSLVSAALTLTTTSQAGATPSPTIGSAPDAKPGIQSDNHPDPLAQKRSALRQRAVDQLVAGKARTVGKGEDRTIRTSDGTLVDYPVTQSAQLLTFLVDFGDGTGNTAFPDNTAGPVHNQIAEPDASDNSTYWEKDFSRAHYLDMFFKGLPDQDGESFHDVYKEMSSGRFDLEGDVSDWVSVAHPESYYQDATGNEDGSSMKNFIQDTANAWYDAQKAAGKSDAQIEDYLKSFDVWDRYDYDHDGNYNEPDGYIDHFQAIHAGEGEEAGAPAWTIWSHRWSANPNGKVGPTDNQSGGVQIGDTGLWIRDYTTEPENGGLGVFAHEFGHDLGLPDYYDTVGGDNATGFWNLMSSGSWMGHGTGTTGTTPDHMGATEKLFLGWYGNNDLAIVDGTDSPKKVVLGPSYHATTRGAQAVAVTLPRGSSTVDVVTPDQGTHYFYSGNGDDRVATVTSPTVTVPTADPTVTARVSYSIEDDYDYAYAQVSNDGGATWINVKTSLSTTTDPNQANEGFGITGCSGTRDADGTCDNAWTDLTADLTAYAGQDVQLRFKMVNDAGYHELGFSVDSIALGGKLLTDVEDGAPGWTTDKFRVMDGSSYTTTFDQYYLAENRQYRGYDKTLAQGPYSYDYATSAPNKVDQFPYQDGLLVWYSNGLYNDNNTSSHPGGGAALPIDANPTYNLWMQGDKPTAWASGRLQSYDATFDVDQTDGLHLTNEKNDGMTYEVDAHPSIPVFDDSDVNAYWDDNWARSGWYSTKVAGEGAMIQVLSSDERTGSMVLRAGHRFVAATSAAAITGTPRVGETLTATAPSYFQQDATPAYQWQVDGRSIWGATGSTYEVKPADADKTVSVVVSGTKTGYLPAKDTASVDVTRHAAPRATSAPEITGAARVGTKLTVTPASWPVDGTSTYAWKAGHKVVGTGTSYTLRPADAGKAVRVVETHRATGYEPGTATSDPTARVKPAAVELRVKAPAKVARGESARITVSVASHGQAPTGRVRVTFGGKSVPATSLSGGRATIRLPKLHSVGARKVVVRYLPGTGFSRASKAFTIRVTR